MKSLKTHLGSEHGVAAIRRRRVGGFVQERAYVGAYRFSPLMTQLLQFWSPMLLHAVFITRHFLEINKMQARSSN
jgi:hypothetical protein